MKFAVFHFYAEGKGKAELKVLSEDEFNTRYTNIADKVKNVSYNQSNPDFYIGIYLIEDFFFGKEYTYQLVKQFRSLKLDDDSPYDTSKLVNKPDATYKPIIFIGENPLKTSVLAARKNYFDCCIWNKYVSYKNDKGELKKDGFWGDLQAAIKDIEINKEFYVLPRSKEYLEFITRQFLNSYLKGGGHEEVIPYQFHSETDMKVKAEQLKGKVANHKWKFLLIDDHSNKPLISTSPLNKLDVVKKRMEYLASVSVTPQIDICSTISEAADKLIQKSYDMLLVDYLLDDWQKDEGINTISESKGQKNFRLNINGIDSVGKQYGTQLLQILEAESVNNKIQFQYISQTPYETESHDFKFRKGPFRKHWILPITGFTQAFFDDLQQKGINFISPYWYLERGGDPVNTPNLFMYKLLSLMQKQIEFGSLDKNKMIHFFISRVAGLKTKNENSKDKEDDINTQAVLEKEMRINLNRFLFLFGSYEMLNDDKDKESELAKSLLSSGNDNIEVELLFNRIRKLLYMLAYRNYYHLSDIVNTVDAVLDSVLNPGETSQDLKNFKRRIIELINAEKQPTTNSK